MILCLHDEPTWSFLYRKMIRIAADQPDIIVHAGHFLQEEKGEELARHIVDFIDRT